MIEGGKPVTIEELEQLFPKADFTALKPTALGRVNVWLGKNKNIRFDEKLRRGYGKKYRGDHHQQTHGIFALLHLGTRRRRR